MVNILAYLLLLSSDLSKERLNFIGLKWSSWLFVVGLSSGLRFEGGRENIHNLSLLIEINYGLSKFESGNSNLLIWI